MEKIVIGIMSFVVIWVVIVKSYEKPPKIGLAAIEGSTEVVFRSNKDYKKGDPIMLVSQNIPAYCQDWRDSPGAGDQEWDDVDLIMKRDTVIYRYHYKHFYRTGVVLENTKDAD